MTGRQLHHARKQAKRTQVEAAGDLGVTQAYLSMLEKGKRPVSDDLKRKVVHLFGFSPTQLPLGPPLTTRYLSDDELATDLATLGYGGFSFLAPTQPKNPAEVLLHALDSEDRNARLVEALPWLVLAFPEMDWENLVAAAKVNDLQNRLGYVTNVARRVATFRKDKKTATLLRKREASLEGSRLLKEETLCRNNSMTETEKRWLKSHRPKSARHWHLLTDLSPESVNYYVQ